MGANSRSEGVSSLLPSPGHSLLPPPLPPRPNTRTNFVRGQAKRGGSQLVCGGGGRGRGADLAGATAHKLYLLFRKRKDGRKKRKERDEKRGRRGVRDKVFFSLSLLPEGRTPDYWRSPAARKEEGKRDSLHLFDAPGFFGTIESRAMK